MDLSLKKILITGGCSGIGRYLVDFFKEKNYLIAIFDNDEDSFKKNFSEFHPNIRFLKTDVSDDYSVSKSCETLFSELFFPDVLINNAGLIHNEPLINFLKKENRIHSRDSWKKIISTDLDSVFFVTSRVVDSMISQRKKGVVISISSICSNGNIGQSAHSAAKAGVDALTKTWSKEVAPLGIRFASISPGFLATDSTKNSLNNNQINNLKKIIPLNKLGNPISIAQTADFIISNEYINGSIIEVDGGLVI